jgi:hypothetical protein
MMRRILILVVAAALALAATGCGIAGSGSGDAASAPVVSAAGPSGVVHGGQQPINGATIQLWAVDTTGAGAVSKLTSTVTTNSVGFFTITGDYTCPSPTTQMYITATGGNPGLTAGTNNGALALMTALGSCSTLASTPFININEITTVASVWALQQFMGANFGTAFSEDIGVGALAQTVTGMQNAFLTVPNMVNIATGQTISSVSNATIEQSKINTIANILASCVNSDGTTACQTLFADVTPTGSTFPADTIQAALYMAQNPTNNVANIYGLQTAAGVVFTPNLSSAPNDWTLAIVYSGTGLNIPYLTAADASGNIWITNAAGSSGNGLVELGPNGQAASGSPFLSGSGTPISGPQTVAPDTVGNIWVANHGSGANDLISFPGSGSSVTKHNATSGCLPESMALDGNSDAFFACAGTGFTNLYEFANTGTVSSPAYGSSATQYGAVGSTPEGIAIDGSSNVWVANNGSNTVTEFAAGSYGTVANTFAVGTGPYGIAVDHANNVWVANGAAGTVGAYNINELLNNGDGTYTTNIFTGGGLSSPKYVAVDGDGNIWVANSSYTTINGVDYVSVSEFDNNGNPLSPAAGTGLAGGFAHATGAGSPAPRGITVDPSGNVWMTGCGSTSGCTNYSFVMELVGAAAPVVTPLEAGVANNELGCCSFAPPVPGGAAPVNTAGSVTLQASSYSPVQNTGSFAFEVTRAGGSTGAISVHYATSNGTGIAGTDYTAQSGTLTWANGDTAGKTITVPFLHTANYSGTKTFTITLSSTTGGATISPYTSELVTVTDNLTPPSTYFTLTGWKETIPVDIYGGDGGNGGAVGKLFEAQTIALSGSTANFSDSYFYATTNGSTHSIVFTAPSAGATTSPGTGSDHTRSELRELYGSTSPYDWSSTIGGTMTATCVVNSVSGSSDEATIGQVHGQDYVFMLLTWEPAYNAVFVVVYDTNAENSTSTKTQLLSGVSLGDTLTYSIQYSGSTINTTVKDVTTGSSTASLSSPIGSTWTGTPVYFKFGAYHAASTTYNHPGDQTQVTFSAFSVSHP